MAVSTSHRNESSSETQNQSGIVQEAPHQAFWHKAIDDPIAVFTLWLAVATSLLWAFTALLWRSTYTLSKDAKASSESQAERMEKTIAEARDANQIARESLLADQRAWLSVRASLSDGFEPGRTHEGVDGYYIRLEAIVANHGRSPAMHINFVAHMILRPADLGLEKQLNAFCDGTRKGHAKIGPALFSGQQMQAGHVLFLPQDEIDRSIAELDFKGIFPLVIGSVSYETPHVDGVRQTRFAYHVARIKDGEPFAIMPEEADWWRREVSLIDHETIYPD